MKHIKGFTLIELMIVTAVIGILVAIAYPSYQNSLIKGSRASAKSYLLEVAQKQQGFLMDNRAYGTKAELEGAGLTAPKDFTNFYTLTVTPADGPPPSFTARATPKAGTRQDEDGWLEINETGNKTSEIAGKW